MKFLLNFQVQIFSLEFAEKDAGDFILEESVIGDFFCSARLERRDDEEFLTLILREHPSICGKMKVLFKGKDFIVYRVAKVAEGFIKLNCKK